MVCYFQTIKQEGVHMDTVLIAHNPGPFADALAEYLHDICDVWVCHTGAEALALIDRLHPDVLILYLSLSDMDGISILQKVSYKPKFIIALTSLVTDLVVQQANAVGISDIILIPCRVSIVLDHINMYFSSEK